MKKFIVSECEGGYEVYRYNALSGNYEKFRSNGSAMSRECADDLCETYNRLAEEENEIPVTTINQDNGKKINLIKIIGLIFAFVVLTSFILLLCGVVGDRICRVIFAIIGITISLVLLKQQNLNLTWKSISKLLIWSSSLFLIGTIIQFLTLPYEISAVILIIANTLLILSLMRIANGQSRFILASPYVLLVVPCLYYIILSILQIFRLNMESQSTVYFSMIMAKYLLLSVCLMVFSSNNKELVITCTRRNHYKQIWIILSIAIFISAGVSFIMANQYNNLQEYEVSRPHYIGIHSALDNGYVTYGMTYSEIENVCGPADYISRSNGTVEYAYYGNVQLCFRGGRFNRWNDSY